MSLHGAGKVAARTPSGPLEQHVFEEMGETGPQLGVFVNAARLHPDLDGGNRGGGVALEQDREPVWQNQAFRPLAPESLE